MKKLDKIIPFRRKKKKHEKKLLEDYEKGKILQVDKDIDNKKYLEDKEENDRLESAKRENNQS